MIAGFDLLSVLPYVGSGAVAGVVALIELRTKLQRRIPWRMAWWQLTIRFCLDGAFGAAAYPLVAQLTKGVQGLPVFGVVVLAGIGGATVWRSQALVAGQLKKQQLGIGLETIHRLFCDLIDEDVDGAASDAHLKWRDDIAVPATQGMQIDRLGDWGKQRMNSLRLVKASKKARAVRAITHTVKDTNTKLKSARSDADRADRERVCRQAIIDALDENGGHRFVVTLIRESRGTEVRPGPTDVAM